jgi:D-serine deaminase-like pyridoxal phosphate-dependent protein
LRAGDDARRVGADASLIIDFGAQQQQKNRQLPQQQQRATILQGREKSALALHGLRTYKT